MLKNLCVFLFSILAASGSVAQPIYEWTELTEAPFVNRHNDLFFVDPVTGWIVNGAGDIYKTGDAGESWQLQYRNLNAHFRSVGFLSEQHGFAGNVGPGEFGAVEATPIFETVNGGQTWLPATRIDGDAPQGICGLQVVNDSVVVAVGRVRGPAFFVRTTNAGYSWTSTDMSAYAAGLIDVHFTHPDSGFAVGLTNEVHSESSGVILRTVDGGASWEKIFETSRTGEWAWKISFPSTSTGYVSLQRNTQAPVFFLKTIDGGDSWEEMLFKTDHYFVQGLGFVDENTGWIGGNSSQPVYATIDGGETWQADEVRPRINRIRFLGDSLGYAVGRSVYKIDRKVATGIAAGSRSAPFDISIYPNPANSRVTVLITGSAPVNEVSIFDVTGRLIESIGINEVSGKEELYWPDAGRTVVSGVYFVRVRSSQHTVTTPFVLVD